MNWIAGAAGLYFVSIAIAGAVKRKREGVGKLERVKRRVYKEVSLAQEAGVDFSKKYDELTKDEKKSLQKIGRDLGWKQSKRAIENGKPYVESYYNSLRRAWNAVSGVAGIGRAYDVKDANGNVCLTWIEDAAAHVERETAPIAPVAPVAPVAPKAKKPSKAEQKEAELNERYNWAWDFLKAIAIDGSCSYPVEFQSVTQEVLGKKVPEEAGGDGKATAADMIAWAWANKKFKINKNRAVVTYLNKYNGKEYPASTWSYGEIFDILNKCWQMRKNDQGWRDNADRLDDIRIALLDKAKHMHVAVPENWEEYADLSDETGRTIRGENRYKVLDLINWVLWIHQHYDVGGDTYYPKIAYSTKEEALLDNGGKMQGSGWKIIPVWEVPIEKITGVQ